MRRLWLTIFLCLIFSAAVAQAQRGGGGSHGAPGGGGPAGFGHGGHGHGRGLGRFCNGFNCGFGYGYPYGYGDWAGLNWDFPYWDYVNFPPDNAPPDNYYAAGGQAPPSYVYNQAMGRGPAPAPVEPPKLIEVALPKGESAVKPTPPTLFVLSDGEQLESRRYVLTADSLQIQIGRKQRTIPVSDINVDATIAANQQRGIELTIPQDSSSMFLSF